MKHLSLSLPLSTCVCIDFSDLIDYLNVCTLSVGDRKNFLKEQDYAFKKVQNCFSRILDVLQVTDLNGHIASVSATRVFQLGLDVPIADSFQGVYEHHMCELTPAARNAVEKLGEFFVDGIAWARAPRIFTSKNAYLGSGNFFYSNLNTGSSLLFLAAAGNGGGLGELLVCSPGIDSFE